MTPQTEATIRRRFGSTAARAKRKNYLFTLTLDQFRTYLLAGCVYCDEEATGLDRINPRGGYVYGEVLPACGACNSLRGRMHWVPWSKMLNKYYRKGGQQFLLPESYIGAMELSRNYGDSSS